MPEYTEVAVRVQPRASTNEIVGWRGGALVIRLTAPPVEGAANAACLRLLADLLGVSRARLSIIRGTKARQKLICIADMSVDALHNRLKKLCPGVDL